MESLKLRSIQRHDPNPVLELVNSDCCLQGICSCQKVSWLDLWCHSIDGFTPIHLIIRRRNHQKRILHDGLNIGAETCHFLSIWFDISTRSSNWNTEWLQGEKVFDMHDMSDWERNRNEACGRLRLTALWTTISKKHHMPSFVFSCTEMSFDHNLFHLLHRSTSTKKKGWDTNRKKVSNRWDLKTAKFKKKKERICLLGLKEKDVCFTGNGHLAAVRAKPQHSQRAKPR